MISAPSKTRSMAMRFWPALPLSSATGCVCRGSRSSERTLSSTSRFEPSTLEPTVAELQDVSNASEASTQGSARAPADHRVPA